MRRSTFALILLTAAQLGAAPLPKPEQEKQLREKMTRVQTQLKASQAELETANKKERELAGELGLTQNQLQDFSNKLRETRTELQAAQTQLELLQQRVRDLKSQMLKAQFALERRLRSIEMQGEVSYLAVLMQSSSFADFLNQSEYLQRVVTSDQKLVEEVRQVRDALEREKLTQARTVATIRSLKKRYEQRVLGLDKLQTRQASLLGQLQSQRKSLENYVTELEHLSVAMEQRLQRLIRERQRTANVTPSVGSGHYLWPVQGPVTSEFGYRIHPITGAARFHSGLDIAVDEGVSIRAADHGVVIYSAWYGGYGNCIIIDHGARYTTLYGHCSQLFAREGQRVRQGQPVAAVGSTGMSTGPHLHFEVRRDGTPVDPRGRL